MGVRTLALGLFFVGCGGTAGVSGQGGAGGGGREGSTGVAGAAGNAAAGAPGGAGGSRGSAGLAGAAGPGGAAGTGIAAGGATGNGGSAGAAASSLLVTAPTFSVAAESESTQCVVLDLGNAGAMSVGEIDVTIGAAVYELRITAVSSELQTTPAPCTPFGDVFDAGARPLVFARTSGDDFVFPAGVGYSLVAHQRLRLEIHAFNATDVPVTATAQATFKPAAGGPLQHEAGLLLLESENFLVTSGDPAATGDVFFPLSNALGAASVFRLMGYTHDLGTGVTMKTAASASDVAPASIYAPTAFSPADPPVITTTPPVVLPVPGGVDLACSWKPASGASVSRGPSVFDERCAAFVSYYPAAAAHACTHVGAGVGVTVCCPGEAGCP